MNEPTMETLARRLDRVERENRWLKQAGVVALAVIAAVVLMGQVTQESRIVEAEKFVLKDENGITRGVFGLTLLDIGIPVLALYDSDGNRRAVLGLSGADTPSLILSDETGTDRITIGVGNDSNPVLFFWPKGPHKKTTPARIQLSLDADGYSRLSLGSRKARITLAAASDGSAGVLLSSNGEKPRHRASFHLSEDGSPGLILVDENGNVRAELGSTSVETTRTGVVEQRPESSLVLFNKKGKVIWSAP